MLSQRPFNNWREIVRPGDVVFDVGANVGTKTRLFLDSGARVVCVEPQPDCVAVLLKEFKGNPRVTIVSKGVAEKPGTLELSICTEANTISTFAEQWKTGRFGKYKWDRVLPVPVTTLDELIRTHGLPRYCKIDVEGFEFSVLQGLTRPVPLLSFEFTREFIDNARKCLAHLQQIGFEKFNFTQAEDAQFIGSGWLDGNTLCERIGQIADPDLWGDIYAYCGDELLLGKMSLKKDVTLEDLQAAALWRKGQPLRLHLGCGEQHFEGYLNIDYPPANHRIMNVQADAYANILELNFPPGTVDEIRLHHVFEHFNRVTALAMLIKWHDWLRKGGTLRIETPDLAGSAQALISPKSSWKIKMGAVRHLAGDQADGWAYHLDHWFPERFERTLKQLGFSSIGIQTSSWPHEPFLRNVEATAKKVSKSREEQLEAADALLWESTVAELERPTFEVWTRQLRVLLGGTVPLRPVNAVQPDISGLVAPKDPPREPRKAGIGPMLKRFFNDAKPMTTLTAIKMAPDAELAICKGEPGFVVWFTGFSGAGKTTLAAGLERKLFELGHASYVLDGDRLRCGLARDLGFSMSDRSENIRRTGEVSRILAEAGVIAIVALISPLREDRNRVREMLPKGHFIEAFANCSLETCEQRDVKGLYAKARAGLLKDFTGVTSPYETPLNPEIELRTDLLSVEECMARIVAELTERKLLRRG